MGGHFKIRDYQKKGGWTKVAGKEACEIQS